MDFFNYQNHYDMPMVESPRPPEPSDARRVHSDEEVTLASDHPKKRAGRVVFKETRHPIYRGVRRRNKNKWVCEVREPNKKTRIWLGTYPTAEMAARAHDVASLALRGKGVCLNFADSAWRLPVPSSKDAAEIRRVAMEAAQAFGPTEEGCIEGSSGGGTGDLVMSGSNAKSPEDLGSSSHQENAFLCTDEEEAVVAVDTEYPGWFEGPLLSPPPSARCHINWEELESDTDISLWSYSF